MNLEDLVNWLRCSQKISDKKVYEFCGDMGCQGMTCAACREIAAEEAAKVIEKQIAKKPANLKMEDKTVVDAYCPRCGYSFPDIGGMYEYCGKVVQYEYCPECGQKIDWNAQ